MAVARLRPICVFMTIPSLRGDTGKTRRAAGSRGASIISLHPHKKQARNAGLFDGKIGSIRRKPVLSPMTAMMPMPPRMPMAAMPATVPTDLRCHIRRIDMRSRADTRIDRRGCLRLLRRSRDNQKRAYGGKSENFLHIHLDSPWGLTSP